MTDNYPRSYYAATANKTEPFPTLKGDLDVDVAIVGGGFTGVASAVELAERGLRVALLEANRIGWGASGRNGGQITGSLSGDKAMVREFRRTLGDASPEYVWNLRWRGHDIIRNRIQKYDIQCDLKFGHVQAAWNDRHIPELQEMEANAQAHGMGDEVRMLYGDDLRAYVGSEIYPAGLVNSRNMHVHSLNLCLGEAEAARSLGAHIFDETKVERIIHGKRPVLVTPQGRVTADTVLIAGNSFHKLGRRKLAGMLFPASLGIVATAPLSEDMANAVSPRDYAIYDTRFVLDYYRLTADRRLIFGSGTNYSGRDTSDLGAAMRPAIERTFPALQGVNIDFAWSGLDGISINRIPQLGRVAPNVYYAQGYSGHGIATSHIVGEIMASAITGKTDDFEVFSNVRHWRFPVGRTLGNIGLAVGMWYFQMLEARK